MPFHVTKDLITQRFERCGKLVDVRMLTKKADNSFKGCCFIEFADPVAHQAALNMHQRSCRPRMGCSARRAPSR